MELFVGTFNVPYLYTLSFDPHLAHLNVTHISNATAYNPWLSFAPNQKTLYATAWEPAGVTAYRIHRDDDDSSHTLELINSKPVVGPPGYVTSTNSYLYSAGGASGEVFRVESDGALGDLVQQLDFTVGGSEGVSPPGGVAGLANGTHSVDLSPKGDTLYVADIGANGVWTFSVSEANGLPTVLADQQLYGAPRDNDGPRHAWPHPNGKILYVIGEHSNVVDVFHVKKHGNGTVKDLEHLQGASVLPQGSNVTHYAADEVRLSTGPPGSPPQYLFASTRGRANNANGYVSAFELDSEGKLVHMKAIDLWETPTSGRSANAIEPAPWVAAASSDAPFLQYLALTDDVAGKVRILTFDGARIQELGAVTLEVPASDKEFNGIVQAATAVWLRPV
ncbi:Muconate cycloisomerase 1 [Beauveria brongniartii RCEF 3172]|uniref:Muconate cycloisomerase 1 n=1 Tax=Beauveria brongniartii RCEF 3172 TaxID=1081107 RepID=A0A166Z447_9HYPO|nr:Muconate cycloisomerase 1 [Beauveria brongniartii RCEF 3172]